MNKVVSNFKADKSLKDARYLKLVRQLPCCICEAYGYMQVSPTRRTQMTRDQAKGFDEWREETGKDTENEMFRNLICLSLCNDYTNTLDDWLKDAYTAGYSAKVTVKPLAWWQNILGQFKVKTITGTYTVGTSFQDQIETWGWELSVGQQQKDGARDFSSSKVAKAAAFDHHEALILSLLEGVKP